MHRICTVAMQSTSLAGTVLRILQMYTYIRIIFYSLLKIISKCNEGLKDKKNNSKIKHKNSPTKLKSKLEITMIGQDVRAKHTGISYFSTEHKIYLNFKSEFII